MVPPGRLFANGVAAESYPRPPCNRIYMRRIGTHKDGSAAQRFCDYLTTLSIDAVADGDGTDWDIWIRNEEDVPRARTEWDAFQESPESAKYQVDEAVKRIRDEKVAEHQAQIAKHQKQSPARPERQSQPLGQASFAGAKQQTFPVTIGIIIVSVIASLTSHFAQPRAAREPGRITLEQRTFDSLSFVDPTAYAVTGDPYISIKEGQWWRFITPMFLHGDELHLAFNMLWIFFLGSTIERVQGSLFLVLVVVVTQAAGMLLQVMLPQTNALLPALTGSPFAIGASGAVYGLFGYLWIRPTLDPRYPVHLVPMNVIVMLAWLVICMTPAVENVANGAHIGGLVAGICVAIIGFLAQR